MSKGTAVVVAAVIVVLLPGVAFGQTTKHSKPRTITLGEARQLVYALLKADDWTKLPGFALEEIHLSPASSNYYEIHATFDNPGGGHTFARYAVEATTGDIWDAVICGRYESTALLKAQEALRKRIGMTEAEYRRLRRPGPSCEPDQEPEIRKMGRPMWGVPKSGKN